MTVHADIPYTDRRYGTSQYEMDRRDRLEAEHRCRECAERPRNGTRACLVCRLRERLLRAHMVAPGGCSRCWSYLHRKSQCEAARGFDPTTTENLERLAAEAGHRFAPPDLSRFARDQPAGGGEDQPRLEQMLTDGRTDVRGILESGAHLAGKDD